MAQECVYHKQARESIQNGRKSRDTHQKVLTELRLHFSSVTPKMISNWFSNSDYMLDLRGTFCTEVRTCTLAITYRARLRSYFLANN